MNNRILVFLVTATLAVAMLIQLQTPLNHDIAWTLYGAKKMLAGAEFGKDIIAANPPLIWFVMIPVALVGEWTGLGMVVVFRITISLLAGISLYISYTILSRTSLTENKSFIPCLILLLTLFYGPLAWRDFGQREYLSLLAVLPLTFTIFARIQFYNPNIFFTILVGLAAGFGLALKPYLVVIPVGLVFCSFLYCKWKILRWAEFYSVMVFCLIYILMVRVFSPDYLSKVIPLVLKFYWGFNNPMSAIIYHNKILFISILITIFLLIFSRKKLSKLEVILAIIFLGYLFNLLWQAKGYTYHIYPVKVVFILFVFVLLYNSMIRENTKLFGYVLTNSCFAAIIVCLLWTQAVSAIQWSRYATNPNSRFQIIHKVIAYDIDRLAPEGKFTVFGTHPFPGFPTALNVSAKWVGRSNSHLAIPAIVKSKKNNLEIDESVISFARNEALTTIRDLKPNVVVVDQRTNRHAINNSSFDFIKFYAQDPQFRAVWVKYKFVHRIFGFDIYRMQ